MVCVAHACGLAGGRKLDDPNFRNHVDLVFGCMWLVLRKQPKRSEHCWSVKLWLAHIRQAPLDLIMCLHNLALHDSTYGMRSVMLSF